MVNTCWCHGERHEKSQAMVPCQIDICKSDDQTPVLNHSIQQAEDYAKDDTYLTVQGHPETLDIGLGKQETRLSKWKQCPCGLAAGACLIVSLLLALGTFFLLLVTSLILVSICRLVFNPQDMLTISSNPDRHIKASLCSEWAHIIKAIADVVRQYWAQTCSVHAQLNLLQPRVLWSLRLTSC